MTRPRLLIADDDPTVVAALSAQLRTEFELVATAGDAAAAIELAGQHQPDVALLDVQMPAGGGLSATAGIRKVSPRTAVVILSVDELDSSVVEFMTAGATAYLRKGTPAIQIQDCLHRAIAADGTLASRD
jgi:DNA-binding NarL/FixJ family response regulator